MNKKIKYLVSLFSFILVGFFFSSCSETEEVGEYDNWRARNEQFIDSLKNVRDAGTDPKLHSVIDESDKSQEIFYIKQIEKSEGDTPQFNDSIEVYYHGSYLNGYKFDGNFNGKEIGINDKPTALRLNKMISGWIWSLQYMRIGERWTIYIPWQSGYGEKTTSTGMLGYSTLIFTVQLEKIVK